MNVEIHRVTYRDSKKLYYADKREKKIVRVLIWALSISVEAMP